MHKQLLNEIDARLDVLKKTNPREYEKFEERDLVYMIKRLDLKIASKRFAG